MIHSHLPHKTTDFVEWRKAYDMKNNHPWYRYASNWALIIVSAVIMLLAIPFLQAAVKEVLNPEVATFRGHPIPQPASLWNDK